MNLDCGGSKMFDNKEQKEIALMEQWHKMFPAMPESATFYATGFCDELQCVEVWLCMKCKKCRTHCNCEKE